VPLILNRAPVEKGAHLQSLLNSPVDELPAKFPGRAPTESDVCPLSPPPHILLDPQKSSPFLGSPNRAPADRDAPFLEPYLLKFPVNELHPVPNGPHREGHPSQELSSTFSLIIHLSLKVPVV